MNPNLLGSVVMKNTSFAPVRQIKHKMLKYCGLSKIKNSSQIYIELGSLSQEPYALAITLSTLRSCEEI